MGATLISAGKHFSSLRKTILVGLVGNAIEFYDFIVYAYLAGYFAAHFFPTHEPVAALILSYGAFATGMVMRPIGGIILGCIGDKVGRKLALQLSVALIAIPTLIIGVMPTYQYIGIWAPIGLFVLRMMQGLAVGGEYSSSVVFMVERAPQSKRGFIGSFSPMGAFMGLLLGTAVCFICTISLGKVVMSEWGWRVPFLLSIFLTAFGIWIRSSLGRDQQPLAADVQRSPIASVLKFHWREVLAIAFANTSTGIVSFVGFMYIVPWSVKEAGISTDLALVMNLLSLFLVSIFCLWGGHLGDLFGRVHISRIGAFILFIGVWPAFLLVRSGDTIYLILGACILAIGQGFFVGPLCAAMASLLPAKVRVTGIGLGYSFSVGVFGGFAPMLTEYLLSRHQMVMAPAIVIICGALVSLLALSLPLWRHSGGHLPEDIDPIR